MKISLADLVIGYDGRRIVDGLSLAIEPGEFFTLLGPSGCGKTTLLRAIAGFVSVQSGTLRFGDRDVTRLPPHKRNIGMVFQDYALFPDKTVFDNVAYGLRARNENETSIKSKVAEALERVGLGALGERRPAALSGGQRQRVALARALVIAPDVLLMDEPLSNLDAKLRHQVRETIMQLQRDAGITTVFVTHDQDEALAMSDRIGVMNAGRLEQVGPPRAIYGEPRSAYVADFIGAANILDVTVPGHVDTTHPVAISLDGSPIMARAVKPLQPGAARLVIRPEDAVIDASGQAGPGRLTARIARRQYLGSRTHYTATLPSGTLIAIDCAGDGHDRFVAGDSVSIVLNPAKTLVLQP